MYAFQEFLVQVNKFNIIFPVGEASGKASKAARHIPGIQQASCEQVKAQAGTLASELSKVRQV